MKEKLEERKNWLLSLSQEDREFISRYGLEMWNKRKAMKIAVEESKTEAIRTRKEKLLKKIDADIANLELEMQENENTVRGLIDEWTENGFMKICLQIYEQMQSLSRDVLRDGTEERLIFEVSWAKTKNGDLEGNIKSQKILGRAKIISHVYNSSRYDGLFPSKKNKEE